MIRSLYGLKTHMHTLTSSKWSPAWAHALSSQLAEPVAAHTYARMYKGHPELNSLKPTSCLSPISPRAATPQPSPRQGHLPEELAEPTLPAAQAWEAWVLPTLPISSLSACHSASTHRHLLPEFSASLLISLPESLLVLLRFGLCLASNMTIYYF